MGATVCFMSPGYSRRALLETVHHHARFMRRTDEEPGWTSQFREVVLGIDARLHDLRGKRFAGEAELDQGKYSAAQALGSELWRGGSDGLAWPSVRHEGGECAGLFYPDCASEAAQGRHLDYHWNGNQVDFYREWDSGRVFEIAAE